jgi:hypothetical protein
MSQFAVYTYDTLGADGLLYGVRLLLTPTEAEQLQRVKLVPKLWEVVGMKEVAEVALAMLQKDYEVSQ